MPFPTQFTHPWLVVCSAKTAMHLVDNHVEEIGAIVSIADVYNGVRPAHAHVYKVRSRLFLTFDDADETSTNASPPTKEDVHKLVRFALHNSVDAGQRALVHCHQGISRSTAAGLIWLAAKLGPGREDEAAHQLLAACEDKQPVPNLTMMKHADVALGRNGKLLDVSKRFYRVGALLAAMVGGK